MSKFGEFIKKAGKIVPELLGIGTKLASGNITGALNKVGNILSKKSKSDNPEISLEAKKLLQEFELKIKEFEIEAFELEVQDRQSARKDGDKDLQKVVAYFSLIGFVLFTATTMVMSYQITVNEIKINEFVIMTVSNGNGVFTALLFTLKDFLWGGSVSK